MKKLLIPLLLLSGIFAVYEQSQDKPNLYLTAISFVVFMFSIMQISFKVPSKKEENTSLNGMESDNFNDTENRDANI